MSSMGFKTVIQVTAKDHCHLLKLSVGFGDYLVQVTATDNFQLLKSSMGFGDYLVQVTWKLDDYQLLKSSMESGLLDDLAQVIQTQVKMAATFIQLRNNCFKNLVLQSL